MKKCSKKKMYSIYFWWADTPRVGLRNLGAIGCRDVEVHKSLENKGFSNGLGVNEFLLEILTTGSLRCDWFPRRIDERSH